MVKPLEWHLAAQRKASGGRVLRPIAEGKPERPPAERGVGAPNAAGARFLLAGSQAWHAHAEAAAGRSRMSAFATSLRTALLTRGHGVEVVHVVPNLARVTAHRDGLARQYPHATASRHRRWTPISWRRCSRLISQNLLHPHTFFT